MGFGRGHVAIKHETPHKFEYNESAERWFCIESDNCKLVMPTDELLRLTKNRYILTMTLERIDDQP
jgi:hypothetical protein